MTDRERDLYRIVAALSSSNVPIVFKGALVTNLVLAEHEYEDVSRGTKDIDANWIDGKPEINSIANSITASLRENGLVYHAEIVRPYEDNVSAGIYIRSDETNELITKMDIDVKPLADVDKYYVGEVVFRGASADQILSDKINVISGDKLLRRAKDLLDVYTLSKCTKTTTSKIIETLTKSSRQLGDFSVFLNRKSDLEHAYNMIKGVRGKPPCEKVYSDVTKFVSPFIEKRFNLIWLPGEGSWGNVKDRGIDLLDLHESKTVRHKSFGKTISDDTGRDGVGRFPGTSEDPRA